jgi:hypothetical protein
MKKPHVPEPSFFVRDGGGRLVRAWHLDEPSDYEAAVARGRQAADDLVQYLRSTPGDAGRNLIGRVISDPAFRSPRRRGTSAGFTIGIAAHLAAGG